MGSQGVYDEVDQQINIGLYKSQARQEPSALVPPITTTSRSVYLSIIAGTRNARSPDACQNNKSFSAFPRMLPSAIRS
jgi:hypothetical protein